MEQITPLLPGDGPLFEVISTYPGWQSDWKNLNTSGLPLLDEAVKVIGLLGTGYYVVPLVNGDEITHLALYPLQSSGQKKMAASSPIVVSRSEAQNNTLVQAFLKSGLFRPWEEKGYTLKLQGKDLELASLTRSGDMGIEGFHTIYFNILLSYGSAYEDRDVELYTLSIWNDKYAPDLYWNSILWDVEDLIVLSFPMDLYSFEAASEKYRQLLNDMIDDLHSEFPLMAIILNQGPQCEGLPPGAGGGGGGSGSGSGGDGSVQSGKDALQVVNRLGDSDLSESEQLELEKAFDELISKYPEIRELLETWSGNKISFYIGELKTPEALAEYNPVDRTITFSEENGINSDYLREEFLHAAQHDLYGDNMQGASRNVEFEVKVFQDLMNMKNGVGGTHIGTMDDSYESSYRDAYGKFIIDISLGESFDIDVYNELFQGWKGYEGKPASSGFNPELIQQFF